MPVVLRSPEYLLVEYDDPKIGGVNGMGDCHGSHLSTGGVGGRGRQDHGGHIGSGDGCDGVGDGSISYGGHIGSGSHDSIAIGVSVRNSKMKLAGMSTERTRSLLTKTAVYFGTVGLSNTVIACDLRGDSNGTLSFINDLSKANHVLFQIFALVNIFGFATSTGALLIQGRGQLKSEVMFVTCSIISFLCMAFSFGVIAFCAFSSLHVLAVSGSNV